MSDFDEAKKFAAQFGKFVKTCERLATLASLEDAEEQTKGRIAMLNSKIAELAITKEQAEARRDAVRAEVALAEVDLREQASRILAAAKVKADEIVAKAEARAMAFDQSADSKREELSKLIEEANVAQRQYAEVTRARAELKDRL